MVRTSNTALIVLGAGIVVAGAYLLLKKPKTPTGGNGVALGCALSIVSQDLEIIQFKLEASGGDISLSDSYNYVLNFGGEETPESGIVSSSGVKLVTHTYPPMSRTYTATLTISDDAGDICSKDLTFNVG